jgi:hypothetical protein
MAAISNVFPHWEERNKGSSLRRSSTRNIFTPHCKCCVLFVLLLPRHLHINVLGNIWPRPYFPFLGPVLHHPRDFYCPPTFAASFHTSYDEFSHLFLIGLTIRGTIPLTADLDGKNYRLYSEKVTGSSCSESDPKPITKRIQGNGILHNERKNLISQNEHKMAPNTGY